MSWMWKLLFRRCCKKRWSGWRVKWVATFTSTLLTSSSVKCLRKSIVMPEGTASTCSHRPSSTLCGRPTDDSLFKSFYTVIASTFCIILLYVLYRMVFGNDPKFLFDHKCPIFKGLVVTASGLESSVREKVFSLSRPAATVIEGCVLTIFFIFRSRRFWRLKAVSTAARWTRTGARISSYRNRKERNTSSRANGKCTSLHRSGSTTASRVATASTNTTTSAT